MAASMEELLNAFNQRTPAPARASRPAGTNTSASPRETSTEPNPFDGASRGTPRVGDDTSMDLDDEHDEPNGGTRLSSMMGEPGADSGAVINLNSHSRVNYQSSARAKGRKHGITSGQIDELEEFCELSPIEMLIDLKIHFMRTQNDILSRFMRIFVRHPDFLTRLRHAVAGALLAPNIPAYLEGVTIQFTKYLEDNAEALLGVPNAQKADPADWALIKSAIAGELTNQRSAMKLKLDQSVKNRQDIYDLTTALMMYDMRPKKEHWGRFAFLRQCTTMYKLTPPKKRGKYWNFIDKCLLDVRKSALTVHPRAEDVALRKQHETIFITHILRGDMQEYALKSGALARTVYSNEGLTDLQSSIEKVLYTFVVDDSPVHEQNSEEADASEGEEE